MFDSRERTILEQLNETLRSSDIRSRIDPIVTRVANALAKNLPATMAWEPIPLSTYEGMLSAEIQSSWVFILRAGATTGAERHPNSHQRMISFAGSGDLQTGGEGNWVSHLLTSHPGDLLEQRWASIPINVWHQAVVPGADWVVVSFHTVPAEELIEERCDAFDQRGLRQRRYVNR